MSSMADAIEKRDSAKAAFEDFVAPIIAEERALTEDEETTKTELRGRFETMHARVLELQADEAREAELAEARAGLESAAAESVTVKSEPRVYGADSPHSYFADVVRSSSYAWSGHTDAIDRLNRYSVELSHEVREGTAEGAYALKKVSEARRSAGEGEVRAAVQQLRSREEFRAGMDTTSGSGGSFVTPQYLVSDYAPYRQFGRSFIDQTNLNALPDYGMTVYLPYLTGPAGVAAQSSQNSGVQETDPTAGYLSNNLTTLAGQVVISQQLLDRAGPNFAFDKMVFDQLNRAYNQAADAYVLTAALASAGTITYTAGSFALNGAGGFLSKVAGAKVATEATNGTLLPATHLYTTPSRWEYAAIQQDTQGRPLVVPNYGAPLNAFGAGSDGKPVSEGNTGYTLGGLPVFQDGSIPTPGTGADQAIVAHMPEVWVFEGNLVPRVIPQTYAQNLSVLLDLYTYITCIVRYPSAVQKITGTGMASITF